MASKAKVITYEDDFHRAAAEALEALYKVAKAAYGPSDGVAWVENTYGDPLVSRDGVTNLDSVHLTDPVANMIARGAIQASKRSNSEVGDGTTAVIILAHHLYKQAYKYLIGGYPRTEIVESLRELVSEIETWVDSIKIKATPELLKAVAIVSCGEEALGALVADTVAAAGPYGGVPIFDSSLDGVLAEVVDGFYWPKGFTSVELINDKTKNEANYGDVAILISQKRLATVSDIAPILDKIVGAGISDLVIIGDVDQEALGVLALLRTQGTLTCTPVDVPAQGGHRALMLDDLALVTGGKVIPPSFDPKEFDPSMLGAAQKVQITATSCNILGIEGDKKLIKSRIKSLEKQYDESSNPGDKQTISTRLGRLRGQVGIIHVGGATEIAQQETKLRVQDAVCAVQAASKGGVVPGGGVSLAVAKVSSFKAAVQAPFKDLVENSGGNPEWSLGKLRSNNPWKGYDLTTLELTDLKERGIVDPAEVTKQTIINAVSVVEKIVRGTVAITYADRESRRE